MLPLRAGIKKRIFAAIAAAWIIASLTSPETVYGDAQLHSTFFNSNYDQIDPGYQCTTIQSDSALCTLKTEMKYHQYLNTPLTAHERFSSTYTDAYQRRTDLLAVFKLAMEEFDFLSGVRIYWDSTERNLKEWAVKLRLRGEIALTDPGYYDGGQYQHLSKTRRTSTDANSKLSLIMPDRIKWNLGLDPDDMTIYGDLHLNSHLRINGEFGEDNKVGLYFKYNF